MPPGEDRAYKLAVDRCRIGLRVLLYLARCDGEFHASERQAIIGYCARRIEDHPDISPLEPVLERLLRYADRQLPTHRIFSTALDRLAQPGNERHLRLVARSARALIDADGAISPEEFEFANELAQVLQAAPE